MLVSEAVTGSLDVALNTAGGRFSLLSSPSNSHWKSTRLIAFSPGGVDHYLTARGTGDPRAKDVVRRGGIDRTAELTFCYAEESAPWKEWKICFFTEEEKDGSY